MVVGVRWPWRYRTVQYRKAQVVGLVDRVRQRMSVVHLRGYHRTVGVRVRRYLLWGSQLLSRKKVDQ